MLKKVAALVIGLAVCAPAMANTTTHHKVKNHKYTKVVYVVERPVRVERVFVVRNPNGTYFNANAFYRYPSERVYIY